LDAANEYSMAWLEGSANITFAATTGKKNELSREIIVSLIN